MVKGHALFVRGVVAPGDLPQARYAGPHHAVFVVDRAVFVYFLFNNGARPHKAHVARNHIQQLRQLIQAHLAQQASHACYAGIVLELLVAHPFCPQLRVTLKHFVEHVVSVFNHGAELEDQNFPAAAPNAALAVKHRPLAVQTNGQGQQQAERQQNNPAHGAKQHIHAALDAKAALVAQILLHLQAHGIAQVLRGQPVNAETVAEERHHQNAFKISAGLGYIVHGLPLARLLQQESHRLGIALRGLGKLLLRSQFFTRQGHNADRVQPAFRTALEITPEFASAVAGVKDDQRPAPPPAADKKPAAKAAHKGKNKNGRKPAAGYDNARIGVARFGNEQHGQNDAVHKACKLEQGLEFTVGSKAYGLVQPQPRRHERAHQQQGQGPVVQHRIHVAKGRAQ